MTSETSWQATWPWPVWVAVTITTLLVLIVYWSYRSELQRLSTPRRYLMTALRLLAIGVLVWMTLGWLVERHRIEPPELIVAVDDSASMSFSLDDWDPAARNRLRQLTGGEGAAASRFDICRELLSHPRYGWLGKLSEAYRIRLVLLGDTVRDLEASGTRPLDQLSPERPASRLGAGLRTLLDAQRARPTAAIVVLTDGITTDGPTLVDAANQARQQSIPLFLVGVASSKPLRDVRLSDLLAEDVVFVDDLVTISCQLRATGLAGQPTRVRVKRADTDEALAEQQVTTPTNNQPLPLRLTFQARTAGQYPLRVSAEPVKGEADDSNNDITHHLLVHDSTIRVLLVQAAPSYEYRFLKDLLSRTTKPTGDESEKAFALTVVLQQADREWTNDEPWAETVFPLQREDLFRYDVVILGDADPAFLGSTATANLVDFVQEQGGGVALLAGPRFMPLAYANSPLEKLLPFDLSTVTVPASGTMDLPSPVQLSSVGQLLPQCQLLPLPADNARLWSQLPGIYWNLDIPDPSPGARILVEHGSSTDGQGRRLPIILLQYNGAGRVVFHATDETYRWARFEGNDEYYSRYWLQTIRYLCRAKLLSDGAAAELTLDRQQYQFDEPVVVKVRFRQLGQAPAESDSVAVVLERDRGRRQQLVLQRDASQPAIFSGTASGLSAGEYRVWLAAPILQPAPTARSFTIAPPTQELALRPLNTTELERAAKTSQGQAYRLGDADRLLRDLPRGQQVRVETLPPEPIWNSSIAAAVFVACLTLEWILRKQSGLL